MVASTLISTFETVDKIFGFLSKAGKDTPENIKRLETVGGREILYSQGSMTKLLSKFIIEPNIIVSDSLKTHEEIENNIKFQVDLFALFYIRVFDVLHKIHHLDVQTSFNLLASNNHTLIRDLGNEEYSDVDLMLQLAASENKPFVYGLEARSKGIAQTKGSYTEVNDKTISKYYIKDIEVRFDVKVENNHIHTVSVPVMIKPTIKYVPFISIRNLLEVSNDDKHFINRWYDFRSGGKSISDLIFATDLVKEYKAKRLDDSNSLIKNSKQRARNAASKILTDGASGFEKYYQTITINNMEQSVIERDLRGKLKREVIKEKFLTQTSSLLLSVMNDNYDMVEFYVKDLSGSSIMKYKQLKSKSKDDSMEDLYKILVSGKAF